MIPETLSQIEARIRQTAALTEDNKTELLKLLAALRTEIGDLARTKSDEAHRIAAIARNSTEAATHDQTNPELVKQSLDQLASAVSGFEESHPRLVEVVNRMATMLAEVSRPHSRPSACAATRRRRWRTRRPRRPT